MAASAIGIRYRPGDIATIRLVVGRGLRKCLRLAIGIGGRGTAFLPCGETAVDTVAVRVVGDDENASLGLCGRRLAEAQQRDETDENGPHFEVSVEWRCQPAGVDSDNVSEIVKRRLTVQVALRSSNFSRVLRGFAQHLDDPGTTNHCAAMNGLNHICGICPEIIR
jgi:hypothetical protein